MKLVMSLLVIMVAVAIFLLLVFTADADAHYLPGRHNAIHAIQLAWCGNSNRECWQGDQAISVAKCEAAQYWTWNIPQKAVGPKDEFGKRRLSMFQMGTRERHLYGHGPDPWSQAFAAYRYYVFSGRDWSPWSCKP
jgi:hypothetical protein